MIFCCFFLTRNFFFERTAKSPYSAENSFMLEINFFENEKVSFERSGVVKSLFLLENKLKIKKYVFLETDPR